MIKIFSSFFNSISNSQIDNLFCDTLGSKSQMIEISPDLLQKKETKKRVYISFISASLRWLPLVYRPATLPCLFISLLIQNKNDTSSIFLSSFIFFEERVDRQGKRFTVFNLQNIILAGFSTALLGGLLTYFFYPNIYRTKVKIPLADLALDNVHKIQPIMDLEQNCTQILHIKNTLQKFVKKNQSKSPDPFQVQRYVMQFIFEDLQIMRDFLNDNESWIIELSYQNKSIKNCLNTIPILTILTKQACGTSSDLQTFCDSLTKQ